MVFFDFKIVVCTFGSAPNVWFGVEGFTLKLLEIFLIFDLLFTYNKFITNAKILCSCK